MLGPGDCLKPNNSLDFFLENLGIDLLRPQINELVARCGAQVFF